MPNLMPRRQWRRHTCAPTTASKSLQLFQAKVVPPSLSAGVKVHNNLRGILRSLRAHQGIQLLLGSLGALRRCIQYHSAIH